MVRIYSFYFIIMLPLTHNNSLIRYWCTEATSWFQRPLTAVGTHSCHWRRKAMNRNYLFLQ